MFTPWLWWDTLYNVLDQGRESARHLGTLHGFTQKVVAERIEKNKVYQKSAPMKKRKALLDLLLVQYDDNQLTLEGIREEVDTFMFAGDVITTKSIDLRRCSSLRR